MNSVNKYCAQFLTTWVFKKMFMLMVERCWKKCYKYIQTNKKNIFKQKKHTC